MGLQMYTTQYAMQLVELYASGKTTGYVDSNAAIQAIQALSRIVLIQQNQIDKLQDTVSQLVAINNDATLNDD